MRCAKCGQEFEGNFCPNCGTPVPRQEHCPQCGKPRAEGERFCSACGHKYETAPASAAEPTEKAAAAAAAPSAEEPQRAAQTDAKPCAALAFLDGSKEKVYPLLQYLPACAFALFAVLLFAFFAAPLAAVPFFGGMGSVYTFGAELPELAGTSVALLVFAVLALGLAACMLAQVFLPTYRLRAVALFGRTFLLGTVLAAAAGVFLFLFFLLGCIACGIAAGQGLSAGACSVLLILFSILFAVPVAAPLLRFLLAKRHPDLAAAERAALAAAGQRAKQQKEPSAALAAFLQSEPVLPPPVPKPQKPPYPQDGPVRDVNACMHQKRRIAFFFLMVFVGLPFLLALVSIGLIGV